MAFLDMMEKHAMTPQHVRRVAESSSRLAGKRGQRAARELADEYRLFKHTGQPIRPAVRAIQRGFPRRRDR